MRDAATERNSVGFSRRDAPKNKLLENAFYFLNCGSVIKGDRPTYRSYASSRFQLRQIILHFIYPILLNGS
jgi:hypothetical protein